MEPNKLEQDFKKKLEQRTIQPSEMAWDRLDAMLSVAEKKKQKPNRTWMYMAASFVVFLLIGALFLNQEKENNGNGVIKSEGTVVTTEESQKSINTQQDNNTVIINSSEAVVGTETSPATEINEKSIPAKRAIHKTTKAIGTISKKEINISLPVKSQEALAVNEKKEPTVILPAKETENLMAAVTAQGPVKKKSSVKVDPNSLLSSVEGELTDSYRNKTFQGVLKNFNAVKTAVANRNHE